MFNSLLKKKKEKEKEKKKKKKKKNAWGREVGIFESL